MQQSQSLLQNCKELRSAILQCRESQTSTPCDPAIRSTTKADTCLGCRSATDMLVCPYPTSSPIMTHNHHSAYLAMRNWHTDRAGNEVQAGCIPKPCIMRKCCSCSHAWCYHCNASFSFCMGVLHNCMLSPPHQYNII